MAGSFQKGRERRPPPHHVRGVPAGLRDLPRPGFRRAGSRRALSGVRFTAIWTPIDGQFEANHALTLTQFDTKWHDMQKGFLHTDLCIYPTSPGLRAAAVWVKSRSRTTPATSG